MTLGTKVTLALGPSLRLSVVSVEETALESSISGVAVLGVAADESPLLSTSSSFPANETCPLTAGFRFCRFDGAFGVVILYFDN